MIKQSCDLILAIDQGTTNSKAVCVDGRGAVVARASARVPIHSPAPGHVEQDALKIWDSVQEVIAAVLAQVDPVRIAGVALSAQRESVVGWWSGGQPIGPVLSWQDTSTAGRCRSLSGCAELVRSRTGLPIDPMFSAPKMRALLDGAGVAVGGPGDRTRKDLRLGTVDSWLVSRLTGGREHITDAGNAARTLLFNLDSLDWDEELLELFAVPRGALAQVRRSDRPEAVISEGPLAGRPVLAVMADSHAALYAHTGAASSEATAHEPAAKPPVPDGAACDGACRTRGLGLAKVTYGTGTSVMVATGRRMDPPAGLTTTLAWLGDRPVFAEEGNIRYSGACLDWAARLLGLPDVRALDELAKTVPDAGGVRFVPAFGGLGAPYWDAAASGTLCDLGAATRPAHIARAALDAVAEQVCDVLDAVSCPSESIHADGGATASAQLMQRQANLLGCPVRATLAPESSALGAARMAAQAAGMPPWPQEDAVEYDPVMSADERAHERNAWRAAIGRARYAP